MLGYSASGRECPSDWARTRTGNCWTRTGAFDDGGRAYVHPGGWIVDPACLNDRRFTAGQFLAALDTVERKMNPAVPASSGGCLGSFNPDWGRELRAMPWSAPVYIACPSYSTANKYCAYEQDENDAITGQPYKLITISNIEPCLGPDIGGLAAVLFHENLHADDADSLPLKMHNNAWMLDQYVFVRDRIYGAQAVCFFGVNPKLKPLVNLVQCRETASYHAEHPRYDLCRGFNTTFTSDYPPGFLMRERP